MLWDISYPRWAVEAFYIFSVSPFDFQENYDVGYGFYGYSKDNFGKDITNMFWIGLAWSVLGYSLLVPWLLAICIYVMWRVCAWQGIWPCDSPTETSRSDAGVTHSNARIQCYMFILLTCLLRCACSQSRQSCVISLCTARQSTRGDENPALIAVLPLNHVTTSTKLLWIVPASTCDSTSLDRALDLPMRLSVLRCCALFANASCQPASE